MAGEKPIVIHGDEPPRESWDDPVKGRIAWWTLFSGDRTPTAALTAGVAELEPGGWLGLHRHAPAEIYYVLEGRGIVTLDGVEHEVSAGSAVFIPGNVEHGSRNPGDAPLRVLYAFAADSFAEVEYRFSESG